MKATVTQFYSDIPAGTIGEVVKQWSEPNGCKWTKLFLGYNAGGQRMCKSFPNNVLTFNC